jgi:hypothetical protein
MTVYDFTGSDEELQTLAENLAAYGIRVRTATTNLDFPSDVAVLHQNGDVLDAFDVERIQAATDFERPLDDEQLERHGVIDTLSQDVTLKTALTVPEMVRVSREFERRAVREGAGTIHAGFQHLSQIGTSDRTMELYRSLATTGVDAYVYGRPDLDLGQVPFTVVEDTEAALERYWFLLYDGAGNPDRKAALVSEEIPNDEKGSEEAVRPVGDRRYRSYFTTNPDTVDELFRLARDEDVLATSATADS